MVSSSGGSVSAEMNNRFPTSNKNMTTTEGRLLPSSAANGQLAGDSLSDEGTRSGDRIMSNQSRVPLHERGINIDELTFEYDENYLYMISKGAPNIALLPSSFERHYRESFAYLRVDEVTISFMLGTTRDLENYGSSDPKKEAVWVIKDLGQKTPVHVFDNEEWVPEFKFSSAAEQEFILALLKKILLSCDDKNQKRFEAGIIDYQYESIKFEMTDNLLSRLSAGEFISE